MSLVHGFPLINHYLYKKLSFKDILKKNLFGIGIWIWAVKNYVFSHLVSSLRVSTHTNFVQHSFFKVKKSGECRGTSVYKKYFMERVFFNFLPLCRQDRIRKDSCFNIRFYHRLTAHCRGWWVIDRSRLATFIAPTCEFRTHCCASYFFLWSLGELTVHIYMKAVSS